MAHLATFPVSSQSRRRLTFLLRNLPEMVSRVLVGVKVISRRVTGAMDGYVYQCLRGKVTEKTSEAGACAPSGPSSRDIEH